MKLLYLIANQPIVKSVALYTVEVAKRTHSSVHALMVAEHQNKLAEAEADLAQIAPIFEGIPYTARHALGDPVKLLNEELAKEHYDMVLMNVHRRRRVWPSEFRFMSQRIIKNCPVPIMLIRRVNHDFRRMLVCTGGLNISKPVVELSAKLAGEAELEATLLNVVSAVPSMYTGMEEVEETLEELLETDTPLAQHLRRCAEILANHNIKAAIEIRHGDVAEAILEEAKEGNYDLIVLGASDSQTLRGLLLGNVTQQIINRATSAVLVVKGPHPQV